jgi:hypothetical protein
LEAVEDAVDEAGGLGGAVAFGEFEGFVDGDLDGDIVAVVHFVDAEAEDVAIDGGHAVEAPVFGDGGDAFVDLGEVGADALDE